MKFIGSYVAGKGLIGDDPGLGAQEAVAVRPAGVLLDDRAPATVDVVDTRLVPHRLEAGRIDGAVIRLRTIGEALGLDQPVGHVDAEAVDPTVEPEPDRRFHVCGDLGVCPVEIGLRDIEQVEVPLAVGNASPGRAAEMALPVVRRQFAVVSSALAEQVASPFGAPRRGCKSGLEPRVLIGGVVGYEVDDDPEPQVVSRGDERIGVGQGPEDRIHVAVVADVVAAVILGRDVERREPYGVDAEPGQVAQTGGDARQVSDAVAVRIGP